MTGKQSLLVLLSLCVLAQAAVGGNLSADDLYKKALDSAQEKDYGGALSYAETALAAYSDAGDNMSVGMCRQLIEGLRMRLRNSSSQVGGGYFIEQDVEKHAEVTSSTTRPQASSTTTTSSSTRLTSASTLREVNSLDEFAPYRSHSFLIGAVVLVLVVGSFFLLHRVKE